MWRPIWTVVFPASLKPNHIPYFLLLAPRRLNDTWYAILPRTSPSTCLTKCIVCNPLRWRNNSPRIPTTSKPPLKRREASVRLQFVYLQYARLYLPLQGSFSENSLIVPLQFLCVFTMFQKFIISVRLLSDWINFLCFMFRSKVFLFVRLISQMYYVACGYKN